MRRFTSTWHAGFDSFALRELHCAKNSMHAAVRGFSGLNSICTFDKNLSIFSRPSARITMNKGRIHGRKRKKNPRNSLISSPPSAPLDLGRGIEIWRDGEERTYLKSGQRRREQGNGVFWRVTSWSFFVLRLCFPIKLKPILFLKKKIIGDIHKKK